MICPTIHPPFHLAVNLLSETNLSRSAMKPLLALLRTRIFATRRLEVRCYGGGRRDKRAGVMGEEGSVCESSLTQKSTELLEEPN